jgi:hypothetical protein
MANTIRLNVYRSIFYPILSHANGVFMRESDSGEWRFPLSPLPKNGLLFEIELSRMCRAYSAEFVGHYQFLRNIAHVV